MAGLPSNPLKSVSFKDSLTGYICGFSSSGSLPGVLSYTHDGGASWHARIVPGRMLTSVCASVDSGAASAVGEPNDAIQATSDSGVTWAEETPVLNRTVNLKGFAYLAGGRRVIVGQLQPANEIAVIASSVGLGPWTVNFDGPYYPAPDPDSDPPITYAELTAIGAAPGGNVAWAVGQDRTAPLSRLVPPWTVLLLKTVNGGSSWTTQTVTFTTPGINCIAVADAQTAFIGQASRSLLRTRNGSTWDSPSVGNSVNWGVNPVNAIDALDANHILFVGDNGRIGWSSNAAADTPNFTITSTQTVTGTTLRGAQMLDATHWIVVGDNETILRTSNGGATWTGSKAMTAPTIAITAPTRENMLASTTISIEGTASDGPGIGVAQVEVKLQAGDGKYFNGSTWQPAETWLPATTTDGWDTWSAQPALGTTLSLDSSLTITARARDGLGTLSTKLATIRSLPGSICSILSAASDKNPPVWRGTWSVKGKLTAEEGGAGLGGKPVKLTGTSSTGVSSVYTTTTIGDGTFHFDVKPDRATTYIARFDGTPAQISGSASAARKIIPPALVGTPVVPSYVTHTRYFTAYADLWPVHTPKTSAVYLYFERYELVGSVRKWVLRKTIAASARSLTLSGSTRSRCSASVKLIAGKSWRVRARHWDPDHLKTYSAYKYFRVY